MKEERGAILLYKETGNMKVMLDKNWAAAVSSVRSYSGRVKNHTRPPIFSIERELEERQLYNNFLYIGWGGIILKAAPFNCNTVICHCVVKKN